MSKVNKQLIKFKIIGYEKFSTLLRQRLILGPLTLENAPEIQRLPCDKDIASTTQFILHPYEYGLAEEWISSYRYDFERGEGITFALVYRKAKYRIGAIELSNIKEEDETASMGYWIGKPFWNLGYCTEAARAILKYGFEELNLNKIHAHHFRHNLASGIIMQKIKMKHEGYLRQHIRKCFQFEDIEAHGNLKQEFS